MHYTGRMDHYTSEKLLLERHAAMIRKAEMRTRLLPARPSALTPRCHIAVWLRALADRIDDRPGVVRALP